MRKNREFCQIFKYLYPTLGVSISHKVGGLMIRGVEVGGKEEGKGKNGDKNRTSCSPSYYSLQLALNSLATSLSAFWHRCTVVEYNALWHGGRALQGIFWHRGSWLQMSAWHPPAGHFKLGTFWLGTTVLA